MTHSQHCSSPPATAVDWRALLLGEYPQPHSCFRLVVAYFRQLGVEGDDIDRGFQAISASERVARIHEGLRAHCIEVDEPRPGDLILLRGGAHIGIVVRPGEMIHSVTGTAAIEEYRPPHWRPDGFWRYAG